MRSLLCVLLLVGCSPSLSSGISLVGVAREHESGYPLRFGRIRAFRDSAQTPLAEAEIAPCGGFRLVLPAAGRYRLHLGAIGLFAASHEVDIGVEQDTIELRLRRTTLISHSSGYDAVMRPGECPAEAYGAPMRE